MFAQLPKSYLWVIGVILLHSGAHLVVQKEVKRESLGAIPYGPDEQQA